MTAFNKLCFGPVPVVLEAILSKILRCVVGAYVAPLILSSALTLSAVMLDGGSASDLKKNSNFHGASTPTSYPRGGSRGPLRMKREVGEIIRTQLTASELAAPQKVNFTLKLRNYDELQQRIANKEILTVAELQARYFPTTEEWQQVATWARRQGYQVKEADGSRMTVFSENTVAQVEATLSTRFAKRIGSDGLEYSSAVQNYILPEAIASLVVGVLQLQPHLQPMRQWSTSNGGWISPANMTGAVQPDAQQPLGYEHGVSPVKIAQLYNAYGLGYDGTGETIVILGGAVPDTADLIAFWSMIGASTTISQYRLINPSGKTQQELDPYLSNLVEDVMDIEMASAMAPGANIILYNSIEPSEILAWLVDELPRNPTIHQISSSRALPEVTFNLGAGDAASQISNRQANSQYYASIAALGITFFAPSGDGGSNHDISNDFMTYEPTAPLQAEYPASDPYVTGVGGTTVEFTYDGYLVGKDWRFTLPAREGGWTLGLAANTNAGGGGISGAFPRPSWQKGFGLPAGPNPMRCVPDVAAHATGLPNVYMYLMGEPTVGGGTSESSPLWAGMCALLNQARRRAGLSPLGLLGPHIYPLIGTAAFNDIIQGPLIQTKYGAGVAPVGWGTQATNGAYKVGPGYDMVTGIGSPNIGNLILALTGHPIATAVSPSAQQVVSGKAASFTVDAATNGTLQWQVSTDHGGTWTNLSDNDTYTGTISPTLKILQARDTMNSYRYRFQVTVGGQATVSNPAILTVMPAVLSMPVALQIDNTGNLYVADAAAQLVRKISPSLQISTLAGSAYVMGAIDGTSAKFNEPSGLALSSNLSLTTSLTVTDTGNALLRRITPEGTVSTWAGLSGQSGSADGAAGAARFAAPLGIASHTNGYYYVADQSNHTIRSISPGGVVRTLAGSPGQSGSADGVGAAARFNLPTGIAIGFRGGGDLYISDYGNNLIRKITLDGVVTTLAGLVGVLGSNDGQVDVATFNHPGGLAFDQQDNLLVVDTDNHLVRKIIDPYGWFYKRVVTLAGRTNESGLMDGTGDGALFNQPEGITIDGSGNIYVADTNNAVVRKITPTGTVSTLALSLSPPSAPMIMTQPSSQSVNVGSSVIMNVVASGTPTPTYQWRKNGTAISGATAASYMLSLPAIGDTGSYTVVVTNAAGSVTSSAATLTVNAVDPSRIAPIITTQPRSQSVSVGISATFYVVATDTPTPTYQWRKDGVAISGATAASYTLSSPVSGDAGSYTVVVTNAAGSVTSAAATLTVNAVNPGPIIITQPRSQWGSVGSSVTFKVVATGTPTPTYAWKKDGAAISGATTASYTLSLMVSEDVGSYTVVVTNAVGSVTSSAATLTLNTAPIITMQPSSQSVNVGSRVTFTVVAIGAPTLTYEWLKMDKTGRHVISGATAASYTLASADSRDSGSIYNAHVTNAAGGDWSHAATLTVNGVDAFNTAPMITTQPISQSVNVGSSVTFSVVAAGTPTLTYEWRKTDAKGISVISGATAASYTLSSIDSRDAGSYTVLVANAAGVVLSSAATLTVNGVDAFNTAPMITTQPISQSATAGNSVTLSVVAAGTPMPTYQWRKNGIIIPGATNSAHTVPRVLVGDLGSYSVVATNAAGTATSNNSVLTMAVGTATGTVPAGFGAAGYLALYPVVAAVFGTNYYQAWLYYRNYGIYQGEVYDELFRVEEYPTLYRDLFAIFGTNLSAYLDHWLSTGRLEGKLGRIPLEFSAAGYFARNPDVATAVGNNTLLAWGHYWSYGIYEGRAYDDELRVFEYLAINADLTAAFKDDWRTAALHWMRYGRTEGRLGRIPPIFSVSSYLARYPEIGASWGTYPTTVFLHFWLYGVQEARLFDTEFLVDDYLALNPDLAAAFGTNRQGAFKHWVRYGRSEGRAGKR